MLPMTTPSSSYSYTTNPFLPVFPSPVAAAVLPAATRTNFGALKIEGRTRSRTRRWGVSSSDNQTVFEVPATTTSSESASLSSVEVVRNFYGGINGQDLASVEDLIAHDCVYEDLIFSKPFLGRKAILEFFQKFIDSISLDLQFVIDDISHEDTSALGVTWHLEWKGKPFPFSKGCSFYRLEVLNGKRQIIIYRPKTKPELAARAFLFSINILVNYDVQGDFARIGYGRDSVEPAIKPGEMALVAIRGVTWLLQRFPQLADQL